MKRQTSLPAGLIGFALLLLVWLVAGSPVHAGLLGRWNAVNSGSSADIEAVAFGNDTFVAVGGKGLILTSQDGVKWTKRSAGITRDFNDVTFSSGRFIAVCKAPDSGVGAKIWISDNNGASWKYRDTDADGDTIVVGLHAVSGDGGGNLVAVGGIGSITRSHDNGTTWHTVPRTTFAGFYGIAYGRGVWVATSAGSVYRSLDMETWTMATGSFAAYKVAFGNNRFVATTNGFNSGFKTSVDGNVWTQCQKAPGFTTDSWPGYSNGVAYGDGLFVVCGGNGDLWTSETGMQWKRWTSPLAQTELQGAVFGQRKFLAVGYKGRMVASPPWMKARLGSTWDYPLTVFDAEDGLPRRIGLPEYRVNTASLNVLLEATLFYMPTLGAPLNMRLVYASGPTGDDADTIGLFGKNWRSRYESSVGQFGSEAIVVTGGGRSIAWSTPGGEDLSTATPGSPISLVPPEGIYDELKFFGTGQYFELKEKVSRLTFRYAVSGGPGNAIWRLTRITDRSGNALDLNVTGGNGRINSISDTTGRTVSLEYDDTNNVCTRIVAPDGRDIHFAYDAHRNLTSMTDMAGYTAFYQYDKLGYLTRMNTAGRVNSFNYAVRPGYEKDPANPDAPEPVEKIVTSVRNAKGDTVRYELLPKDGGVQRTDARGNKTLYKSSEGRTAQMVDPLGNTRKMEYNSAKLPESFTDENGNTTAYEYDQRGNVVKLADALGNFTSYTYDARDNPLTRTNALGKVWSYTYDAKDRVLSTSSPLGNVTTFTYHANGRLNTVMDARNSVTTFTHDARGNLLSVTDPLGNATTLGYDTLGLRCILMTDPRGKQKQLEYDANDRLTRTIYASAPGTPARVNTYDAFGQTAATDELGKVTTIDRNEFGFPTSVTDPLGNVSLTEYDPSNNPVRVTNPLGQIMATTYDDANRPLVFTDARGRTVARDYDSAGNLTSITDKRRNRTRFEYDANNRLVSTIDPLGRAVTTGRDSLGRIETIANARGQQIRFTYDNDGRMVKKEYKEQSNGTFTDEAAFTLDANANVTGRTDDFGTLTRAYDANNQVTSITYPGGKSAGFTYAPSGQLASVTYPNGLVVSYTYDDFNRLVVPARFRSSAASEIHGSRERQNKATSISIALGGSTQTVTFELDATGSTTRIVRPGDTQTLFGYDDAHRLVGIDHQYLAASFFKTELLLNATGSVLGDDRSGTALYEPALPLPRTQSFDAANQLTNTAGKPCTYDADGNLTAIGDIFSAKYTPENRPSEIKQKTVNGEQTVRYTYDAHGQRVKREVVGGTTTVFYYSPGGELLFTTDGDGTIERTFIWNGKALLAILSGPSLASNLRYVHLDRGGNVVALSGVGTGPVAKFAYQPYGAPFSESIPAGGSPDELFSYVGGLGVQHEGNGLFYMQNRFYDSATGRFLQRDPAGFSGGINLYAYVAGNPATHSDPSGLGEALFGIPSSPGTSGYEFAINTVWKKPIPSVPGMDSASSSGYEFVRKLFTEQALNAEKAAGQAGGSYGLAGHGSRAAVNTVSELAERKALQGATTAAAETAVTTAETAAAVEETALVTGARTVAATGAKVVAKTTLAAWFAVGTTAEVVGWATGSDDVSAAGEAMTGVIWPSSWKTAWDYWTGD